MNRKPGDWNCRRCRHLNFGRRAACQLCGEERSATAGGGFGGGRGGGCGSSHVRPGDWYCACGCHNFASRSSCFRCGAMKEDAAGGGGGFESDVPPPRGFGAGGGGRAAWKSGDWICNRTGCKEHNFASRMDCFRCNAPRDLP